MYRPHGLGDPTLPLAVSSAVWSSRSPGFAGYLSSDRTSPLFEFRLPLEHYPTTPSQLAATGRLLSWALVPFSTSRIEGPPNAGMPTRYVPPSGFGYPLDGFLPSVPCRSFFIPAALMGFTLRRFLLPEGIRGVTTRKHPHAVPPSDVPATEAPGRPDRLRLLGFVPSRSPWQSRGCLARLAAGASHGVDSSRAIQ
jgi:hypothetical protein